MDYINSSDVFRSAAAGLKGAAQAGLLAGAAMAAASWLWPGTPAGSAAKGLAWAWFASSASLGGLLAARLVSHRAFWAAFWGGLGLRLMTLAGLMVFCWQGRAACAPALLGGYALGVTLLLPLEYRQVPQA